LPFGLTVMPATQGDVLEWDTRKVTAWLELCGFGEFVPAFKENRITGDVLVELDRDTLKDVGVASVGRRMMLLKAIQGLREQHGLMPDAEQPTATTPKTASPVHNEINYPLPLPCSPHSGDEYTAWKRALSDRDTLIQKLAQEVERLSTDRHGGLEVEQVMALSAPPVRTPVTSPLAPSPQKGSISARLWDADGNNGTIRSIRHVRLQSDAHEYLSPLLMPGNNTFSRPRFQSTPITPSRKEGLESPNSSGGSLTAAPGKKPELECKQSFTIGREDRCAEVLPAVLKKYQIDDDWRMYALYIAYGNKQRHERFIDYDEKVYPIMRSLKKEGENPLFVLKKADGDAHKAARQL